MPYTSPNCSRIFLSIACSCFTSGRDGFANDAEVAAWVISCKIVCTFIPLLASMRIVFVSGENRPAAVRPTTCDRSSTTCTCVSPTILPSLAAISRIRSTWLVDAIAFKVNCRSPRCSALRMLGSNA